MTEVTPPIVIFTTAEASHQNLRDALNQVNELARMCRTQAHLSGKSSNQWDQRGDKEKAALSLGRSNAYESMAHLIEETMLGALDLFELYELEIAKLAPPPPEGEGG